MRLVPGTHGVLYSAMHVLLEANVGRSVWTLNAGFGRDTE